MNLEAVLREVARKHMKIEEGDFFDPSLFVAQANAVIKYIETIHEDSYGDPEYIIWQLRK